MTEAIDVDEAAFGYVLCPTCHSKHRPASPCYAGPSRVEPALYAESAVVAQLKSEWGDLTQASIANMTRHGQGYISDLLSGKQPPSERLLNAMGFERVTFYRRKR
jgi:hypothetical protein